MAIGFWKGYVYGMDESTPFHAQQDSVSPELDELGLNPAQRAALLRSLERSEAQCLAGETVPGEEVLAWIRSWGTENEFPMPTVHKE
jgi:predicted transcriptional regulator